MSSDKSGGVYVHERTSAYTSDCRPQSCRVDGGHGASGLIIEESSAGTHTPASATQSFNQDDKVLRAQGHRAALPRNFGLLSLLSLSFGVISSELGVAAGVGVNLTEGGASSMFWGTIVGAVVVGIISLGMAELASAYPSAGAQYHWAYCIATPRYRRFAAYVTGWLNLAGWWFGAASLTLFCGTVPLGIANLYIEDYTPKPYQFWLCYVACNAICASVNVWLPRRLPIINTCLLWIQLITWIVSIVVLVVLARGHYQSASFIFTDRENLSGWSTNGIAYMIAVGNSMYAYIGTDAAAHLSEEVPRPQRTVPLAMMGAIAIGLATSLPFSAVLMLVMRDKAAVLATTTGLPYLELVYGATESKAAAAVLILLVFLCFLGAANANYTAVSRLTWAFARDGGMPFSEQFAKVRTPSGLTATGAGSAGGAATGDDGSSISADYEARAGTPTSVSAAGAVRPADGAVPANAVWLAFVLIALWGLIYIGSSTAFNAFLSAAIVFATLSYAAPQFVLLLSGARFIGTGEEPGEGKRDLRQQHDDDSALRLEHADVRAETAPHSGSRPPTGTSLAMAASGGLRSLSSSEKPDTARPATTSVGAVGGDSGRARPLPRTRALRLPRLLGLAVNAFSCLWALLITAVFCLPPLRPTTAQNASYIGVVVAGITLLVLGFWIVRKKKTFRGPRVDSGLLAHAL